MTVGFAKAEHAVAW